MAITNLDFILIGMNEFVNTGTTSFQRICFLDLRDILIGLQGRFVDSFWANHYNKNEHEDTLDETSKGGIDP